MKDILIRLKHPGFKILIEVCSGDIHLIQIHLAVFFIFPGTDFIDIFFFIFIAVPAIVTDNIQKKLEDYNRTTSMPFALHASSGYHIAVPTPDKSLFAMVTLADTIMYAEKRKKRHSKYLKSSSSIRQDAESN